MEIGVKGKVIFIADMDEPVGKELSALLKSEGAIVLGNSSDKNYPDVNGVYNVDLTDKSAVEALCDEIKAKYSMLDGYFFNIYRTMFRPLKELTGDVFMEEVHSVTKAAFICMQVFGKFMKDQAGSQAIYMTSLHDHKPNGKSPTHSIAMGTISNLVSEASVAYGRDGIHVNQLRVGPVGDMASSIDEDNQNSAFYSGVQWKTPVGLPENPELDVAKMAMMILSGSMHWLNGSCIKMDGGLEQVYGSFRANLEAHKQVTGVDINEL